jgi:hypothetical protein
MICLYFYRKLQELLPPEMMTPAQATAGFPWLRALLVRGPTSTDWEKRDQIIQATDLQNARLWGGKYKVWRARTVWGGR